MVKDIGLQIACTYKIKTNQYYLLSVLDRTGMKQIFWGEGCCGNGGSQSPNAAISLKCPTPWPSEPTSGSQGSLLCSMGLNFHEDTLESAFCPLNNFTFSCDSYCFLKMNVQTREP